MRLVLTMCILAVLAGRGGCSDKKDAGDKRQQKEFNERYKTPPPSQDKPKDKGF